MQKLLGFGVYLLLAAGLIANAYFMLRNGEPERLWWWPLALVFFAWSAVPYAGVAAIQRFLTRNAVSRITLLVVALVVVGGGVFILFDAFVTNLDAQSGLIFIFLPFLQCAVVGVGSLLVFLAGKFGGSNTSAHEVAE